MHRLPLDGRLPSLIEKEVEPIKALERDYTFNNIRQDDI